MVLNLYLYSYGDDKHFYFTFGSFKELTGYEYNTKSLVAYFCPICGCSIVWNGFGKIGVNARLLDGVKLETLKPTFFDGKSL